MEVLDEIRPYLAGTGGGELEFVAIEEPIVKSARNPKLFWISAGAPLTSVIISTILSFIWKSHSISVLVLANPVGYVTEGMFNSAVGELFGSERIFFSIAEAVAAGACKAQP